MYINIDPLVICTVDAIFDDFSITISVCVVEVNDIIEIRFVVLLHKLLLAKDLQDTRDEVLEKVEALIGLLHRLSQLIVR